LGFVDGNESKSKISLQGCAEKGFPSIREVPGFREFELVIGSESQRLPNPSNLGSDRFDFVVRTDEHSGESEVAMFRIGTGSSVSRFVDKRGHTDHLFRGAGSASSITGHRISPDVPVKSTELNQPAIRRPF
jgi:hypothetical protein